MAAFLLLTTAAAFLAGSAQAQPTVPVCNMDASHLTKDGELDLMKGMQLIGQPDAYCEKHRAELPPLICLLVEKNKLTGLKSKCADISLVIGNPLIQKVLKGEAVTIDDIKDTNGKKFCDCFASQLPMHALCENLPAGQDDCSIGQSTVRELLEACVQEYHGCDYALQKDDHTKTCAEAKSAQEARNGANVDGCGNVVGGTTATATTAAPAKAGDGSPTTAPKNVDDKKMSAQQKKAEVAVDAAQKDLKAAQAIVAQAKTAGDKATIAEAEAKIAEAEAMLVKAKAAAKSASDATFVDAGSAPTSVPTTEATTADAETPTQPPLRDLEDISSSQETAEDVDIAMLEKEAAVFEKQYTQNCATDTQKASDTCKTLKAKSAEATKAVEDAGGGGSAASGLSPLLATCVAGLAAAAGAL